MEKRLTEAKAAMLKGELADFEFTGKMKQNVLRNVRPDIKARTSGKKIFPTLISAALILLFFGGIYEYVLVPHLSGDNQRPANDPGDKGTVPDDKEDKDNEKLPEENEDAEEPVSTPEVETGEKESKGEKANPADPLPTEAPAEPDVGAILVIFTDKLDQIFSDDRIVNHFTPDFGFKYKDFTTKDELLSEIADMAAPEVLKQFDRFFKETPDGLFLWPQDRGLLFHPEEPYETNKINDTEYQLVQRLDTDMYGPNYTIIVTVEYVGGAWLITGIETIY